MKIVHTGEGVTFAKGFQAIGIAAKLKKSGKPDLALIYSQVPATVAGTFTQNKVTAAPVYVSKETVATGSAQAIISNSGCANACTGQQGLADAKEMAMVTAKELHIDPMDVVVGSTGVIGSFMPMEAIKKGIHDIVPQLSDTGSPAAGKAILTTDTHSKTICGTFTVDGKTVHIGAIAKGSGMIHPNMATMLCYITTDLAISHSMLQKALSAAVEKSFNMISVDGDMSTNDMAIILANGLAGNTCIEEENEDYKTFYEALETVVVSLAKEIAADGEGASKFITIEVLHAKSFVQGKEVGMAIANSPLVKTAFFGEDPNWGRIICAAGYSGGDIDPNHTTLTIGGIPIFEKGMGLAFDQEALAKIMAETNITLTIDIEAGQYEPVIVWTCDLTYDYVKINGEYHT